MGCVQYLKKEGANNILPSYFFRSEEDEFETPKLSKEAHREITQQLIKDGYNLDLEPDDEDLDLIPPRPLSERCVCCNHTLNNTCSIQ